MGEVIDLGTGFQGGISLISGLVSVLALGVFLPMWNLGQVTLKH